jgi:hypothetical protein
MAVGCIAWLAEMAMAGKPGEQFWADLTELDEAARTEALRNAGERLM